MRSSINLEYLIENSFNDSEFVKEILQTTLVEFKDLQLRFMQMDQDNFNAEELYMLLHKYKPSANMLKLSTYPLFKEYGTNNNFISYGAFKPMREVLAQNLEEAITDIKEELKKY